MELPHVMIQIQLFRVAQDIRCHELENKSGNVSKPTGIYFSAHNIPCSHENKGPDGYLFQTPASIQAEPAIPIYAYLRLKN